MAKKNKHKIIYRDFNHWFSRSPVHGFSSASRDFAREIWDDFEPTINANLDDHKRAYINLCKEKDKRRSEMLDAMLEYIDTIKRPGDKGFWRWWLDKTIKK